MRGITTIVLGAVLLLWAPPTRADKWQHAASIFDDRCSGCHTLETTPQSKLPPRVVDLSTALDKKSNEALRAWLTGPTKVAPQTACAANLDGAEVDAMLTLFARKRHFVMDKKTHPPAFEARRDPPKWPAPTKSKQLEKRR